MYGKPQIITEEKELKTIVNQLTEIHESSMEIAWKPKYKDSLLNIIVGVKILITELQCKYKLSQNRSKNDREKLIEEFQKRGSIKLSRAMEFEL